MPPHPANFVFLVETGFLRVCQAGLELLNAGDDSRPFYREEQEAQVNVAGF